MELPHSSRSMGKRRSKCEIYICNVFTAQCTLVQMRGLGIACRPSVCLPVCDVGGL